MFKLNLYLPFIIIIILMSTITLFGIIYFQEESIHQSKEKLTTEFEENLKLKIDAEAAILDQYIDFIQDQENLSKLFISKDKAGLNEQIKDLFIKLNTNVELTHMYFLTLDGTVLLRAHDYDRDQDIVKRTTFLRAKEGEKLFYGLEFGPKKNYTLRVVKPWYFNGELIGYFELGKEIDKIIQELSETFKAEIYLAIKKEVYRNSPKFVKEQLAKKFATPNYYIAYATYDIPKEMASILNEEKHRDISLNENEYYASKKVLTDVSGEELVYFIFLSNVTLEHAIMLNAAKILTTAILIISFFLLIGGYIIIRKKERAIYTLTSKLEAQKDALSTYNAKLQNVFDLQNSMVIITDGNSLHMANRAMFDFFGFDDLEDFLVEYKCICDRFIEHDDYFHLKKIKDSQNWVEVMINLAQEDRVVCMIDDNLESHVFNVSINIFDDERHIISFNDISNSVIETNKLKRKVTHDKLTGALNREYFDTHIEDIIQEVYPKKLGMIICDIDYFKKVNDTYGHNRGDIVLKEFTKIILQTIRETDSLIRWGGEEFIILIAVSDASSLNKIAENIRLAIEDYDFEEVKHLTASFGVTLYVESETPVETIERMDRALYIAKNSGRNQTRTLLSS